MAASSRSNGRSRTRERSSFSGSAAAAAAATGWPSGAEIIQPDAGAEIADGRRVSSDRHRCRAASVRSGPAQAVPGSGRTLPAPPPPGPAAPARRSAGPRRSPTPPSGPASRHRSRQAASSTQPPTAVVRPVSSASGRKVARRHHATARMRPARQRLQAGARPGRERAPRLVVQSELLLRDGGREVPLQTPPLRRLGARARALAESVTGRVVAWKIRCRKHAFVSRCCLRNRMPKRQPACRPG